MDKAKERKARPVEDRANHQGFDLHLGGEPIAWWLTPSPDPRPPDYQPTVGPTSKGPYSLDEADQWLREQVAPE
jgi:hypothetical protein